MAKYWYVSENSGTATTATATATTDPATQRTGAYTSMAAGDHFNTIALALAGDDTFAPVAGDFIFVANDHAFTAAGTLTYAPTAGTNTPINVISVLETACDQYTAGASETTSASGDVVIGGSGGKISFTGVNLSIGDDLYPTSAGNAIIFKDATMTFAGLNDQFSFGQDGGYFELTDVTLIWTAGSATQPLFVQLNNANQVVWNNVIVQNGSGTIDDIIQQDGNNGGAIVRFNSCDFTDVGGQVWGQFGSDSVADDNIDVRMQNCKMASDPPKFMDDEDFHSHGQYFLATNCSSDSAKAEYQFYQKTIGGVVQDSGDDGTSGGIYRAETTAFEGTNKTSFKCATSAQCLDGSPLVFELHSKYVDMTSTDTFTFYFATTATLTTANTWVEVSYPDATNKQTWNTKSSRATDILSATALTADGGSSDWENAGTDLTSETESKIAVDCSGDPGAACVPTIKVFTTVPSVTIYVDTSFDVA